MNKEANARIKINKLLEESGWRFFDNEEGSANIQLEPNVKIKKEDIENHGDDFQNTRDGYVDYLLLDKNSFPLVVLEAKKEKIHPLSAKAQAKDYAQSQNCRFIILSNGVAHYLWDLEKGNPEIITEFPTQESLEYRKDYSPNTDELVNKEIDENYLDKRTLRHYQLEAVQAIQKAAKNGKTRFLFEMGTGTGKTTTAGAVCKLFLETGNAKRILFLVDRIELEDQAVKAFQELFSKIYFVGKVKDGNWNKNHIVVSTVQTLLAGDRYKKIFSPTDFELVISDEAHRSLGGNSRAVFEYFLGYKLGLTATPRDFLRGVDEKDLLQKNPKALEQRNLKDTYKTFDAEDGATYVYDLKRAVEDEFLINPYVLDARTEITTQLLSDEGYAVNFETDDGEKGEKTYGAKNFEKTFFNEDTNRVLAETILSKGLKDPITGEFGKTIVFAVSQNHAAKLTNILNKLADKKWEGKYNSDFASQITSVVINSQEQTKKFSANKLNGKTKFNEEEFPDYESSRTRVVVTVGMMTTGYDAPDLLNIVLARPIFSPSDFIQMKGRGTRKNTFIYQEKEIEKEKEKFLLLDFFGTCEYFEKDFDYDEKIKLNISKSGESTGGDPVPPEPEPNPEVYDAESKDTLTKEIIVHVGEEGMRIDRDLYQAKHQQFEQVLKTSKTIQKINEEQGVYGVEEFVKENIFHKPSEYWNAEDIRSSYNEEFKTKRKIPLTEMILKALGLQDKFKTREDRLEEEFQKFITIQKPDFSDLSNAEKINLSKEFFEAYLSDKDFREIIKEGEYAQLSTYPSFGMNELGKLNGLVSDIKNYSEEYLQKEMSEFSL